MLDLGSGLGGPARALAEVAGCRVTGVDLTPEFCEVASVLSQWTGLSDRTHFEVADATTTGLPDAAVDAVMTVHVAMNISDKPALYAEAFRVLRPGGRFVVYDVLQVRDRVERDGPPPVTFAAFLGDAFGLMAANQVANLAERRIRTVMFTCTRPA